MCVTIAQNGTGLFNQGTATLHSTILAENGNDFATTEFNVPASGSYNLIGDAVLSGGFTNGVNGNIVGVNPTLRPLQNNGGPTLTHALDPHSIAIDRGDPSLAGTFDQRGLSRPQRNGVDIGAFELRTPVHLAIPATSGDDSITVDHQGTTTTITKNGTATVYVDDELLSINIQTGAGNDTIRINGSPKLPTTVLAGRGNDTIIAGGGRYDFNILGELTVDGGDGDDDLTIDDAQNNSFLLSTDSYNLDRELRNGIEYGTFAKGRLIPQFPPTPEGFSPELAFTGVEDITLEGSLSADRFDVNGTPANVVFTLKGNDNDDTFNVGGGDYDNNIRSSVSLVGGWGDNEVEIDDTTDNGNGEHYVLNNNTFTKTNTGVSNVPTLVYSGIVEFTVQGSDYDNVFQVDSTHFSTDYVLRGNDGADEFLVLAEGLLSGIRVIGGQPNSAPGDTLRVTGTPEQTATYTPDFYDPGTGAVVTQGLTIRFSGLEPVLLEGFAIVKMMTPRSYDVINVTPESDGWTKISGGSGGIRSDNGILTAAPFESLSFRDVKNVTLDTATFDLVQFPIPPIPGGFTYYVVPNDTVTIEQGALDARGLESFSVITGLEPMPSMTTVWKAEPPCLDN